MRSCRSAVIKDPKTKEQRKAMVKNDKKLDPLITIDPVTGRLVYHTTKHGERLLDYSVCGYKGGGVALPAATVGEVREVEPAPGNTADHCESDDTERLQAKIDTMGIDGGDDPFKGHKPDAKLSVLLLKAGTYYVKGQLKVIKHGVVIRGEGPDVTTIIATGKDKRSVIHLVGGRMGKPFNKYGNFPITGDHVRLGETTIPVKHDGHLGPGDRVWLRRKPNVSFAGCWLVVASCLSLGLVPRLMRDRHLIFICSSSVCTFSAAKMDSSTRYGYLA